MSNTETQKSELPPRWFWILVCCIAIALVVFSFWNNYRGSIWADEKAKEIAEHGEWFVLVTEGREYTDKGKPSRVWHIIRLYKDPSWTDLEVKMFIGSRKKGNLKNVVDFAIREGGWVYDWPKKDDPDVIPKNPAFEKGAIQTYARSVRVRFYHIPDERGYWARCLSGGVLSDRLGVVQVKPGDSREPTSH